MKAMILAAGLGTRLRPLTDDRPKALVTVGGYTLLEIVLRRLREAGVTDVIVNVHHFADAILDFLKTKGKFGMRIEVSREEMLLDTGGGLKRAASFFLDFKGGAEEPFLLHNVDVASMIDLEAMIRVHRERRALATLAVQKRESARLLLFDEAGALCGRRTRGAEDAEWTRQAQPAIALAFSGIHVLSPRLLSMLGGDEAFSIIPAYLRMAAAGEKILAYRCDYCYWRDLGSPESIRQAGEDLEKGLWSVPAHQGIAESV
jgi:NDP-sugar pyrophosphorylase family protein